MEFVSLAMNRVRLSQTVPIILPSQQAETIVSCSATPVGDGVKDVNFVKLGPYIGELSQWFDTFDGSFEFKDDWFALEFPQPVSLNTFFFMHGPAFVEGGWFKFFELHYLDDAGEWQQLSNTTVFPEYDFGSTRNKRKHDEAFYIRFPEITTKGIRLYGHPGGKFPVVDLVYLAAGNLDEKQANHYLSHLKQPLPKFFQFFPPIKTWTFIEKIRNLTEIAFDIQVEEGARFRSFLRRGSISTIP